MLCYVMLCMYILCMRDCTCSCTYVCMCFINKFKYICLCKRCSRIALRLIEAWAEDRSRLTAHAWWSSRINMKVAIAMIVISSNSNNYYQGADEEEEEED